MDRTIVEDGDREIVLYFADYAFSPDIIELPKPAAEDVQSWVERHARRTSFPRDQPITNPGRLCLSYSPDMTLIAASFSLRTHQEDLSFSEHVYGTIYPNLTSDEAAYLERYARIDRAEIRAYPAFERAAFLAAYEYPGNGPNTSYFVRPKTGSVYEVWKEEADFWLYFVLDIDKDALFEVFDVSVLPDRIEQVVLPPRLQAILGPEDPVRFATNVLTRLHPKLEVASIRGRMLRRIQAEVHGIVDGRWRRYNMMLDRGRTFWRPVEEPLPLGLRRPGPT